MMLWWMMLATTACSAVLLELQHLDSLPTHGVYHWSVLTKALVLSISTLSNQLSATVRARECSVRGIRGLSRGCCQGHDILLSLAIGLEGIKHGTRRNISFLLCLGALRQMKTGGWLRMQIPLAVLAWALHLCHCLGWSGQPARHTDWRLHDGAQSATNCQLSADQVRLAAL